MTSRPDQVLTVYTRDQQGRLRKRVRRLPRGARMVGAAAPWVWARLQAEQRQLAR